jgi:hypothetical protein
VYKFWWGSPKERDHLEDRGVDGIRMDLGDIDSGMWSAYSWLRIGSGGGSCECGDDPSGSGFTEVVSYILHNRAWLVGGKLLGHQ